jgi:hypothetical protein
MTIDIGQTPRLAVAFSRRRMLQRILMYAAYVPVIFALYVRWNPDFTLFGLSWGPLFGMGVGLCVALVVASYLVWRCPACNRFLGMNRHVFTCKHCKTDFSKTPTGN